MTKFALQARWVVPIETPPIEGGVVTIDGDKIIAVGTRTDDVTTVQDLGDVVLIPGLVNAHTHLEFSQLANPLGQPGLSLPEWIQLVIAGRKQPSDAAIGLVAGLQESLRSGVTSLGEISTTALPVGAFDSLPELVAFQEVIGFSAARIDSVFRALEARIQASPIHYRHGVSPHAPYTVHPELLQRIIELACRHRLPVAMHLAESREELQLLRENKGPFRELLEAQSMWDSDVFAPSLEPLDYLRILAQAPRSLVVHGNYLSQQEIEFIADSRHQMSIVYCPRTHAYFGHPPYPLQEILAAGGQLAVGTDSRASNPDLSLLSELQFIAQTHPNLAPEQVFRLGTLSGAEALGIENQVGSLVPGKLANLTTIVCDRSKQAPLEGILSGRDNPQQTWLRGREIDTT